MRSLKVSVLSNFLVLFAGLLFVGGCEATKQVEKTTDAPTVSANVEKTPDPVIDKRFENSEHNDKLQAETDALLPLFDRMPPVPIYVKDAPMLKTGTNTEKGAAYTFCSAPNSPLIFMKKIFYEKANKKQLVNALKHELTHAWLCRKGLPSEGHDARFRQKFTQVGGFGN